MTSFVEMLRKNADVMYEAYEIAENHLMTMEADGVKKSDPKTFKAMAEVGKHTFTSWQNANRAFVAAKKIDDAKMAKMVENFPAE